MVLAETRMKVLNKEFQEGMADNTSNEFAVFAVPFNDEVMMFFSEINNISISMSNKIKLVG